MIEHYSSTNDDNMFGYFEQQLLLAVEMIQVPFAKRKLILNYEDPSEAIGFILGEVQEVESKLRQCVEIGSFVLDRNKELIAEHRKMQISVETMQFEH